ncbi:bacteriocin [Lactococcus sp.]|uniref:bacteriocin n=1 Tax=Lactococcus sp. TaxID=44273 RepID=UPI002FC94A10
MEGQKIFEVFETLTDAELMEISGGNGVDSYYQSWLSPLLDIGPEGDLYSHY